MQPVRSRIPVCSLESTSHQEAAPAAQPETTRGHRRLSRQVLPTASNDVVTQPTTDARAVLGMDAPYANRTGRSTSATDQIAYIKFDATRVHPFGMRDSTHPPTSRILIPEICICRTSRSDGDKKPECPLFPEPGATGCYSSLLPASLSTTGKGAFGSNSTIGCATLRSSHCTGPSTL